MNQTEARAPAQTGVRFTNRGEAALDELATVLTARCSNTPDGIARVLDEVLHTHLDDLTSSLDAIAVAATRRQHPGEAPQPGPEQDRDERLDPGRTWDWPGRTPRCHRPPLSHDRHDNTRRR